MIYVTHDQIEALTLADRIAVMHAGVIQQLDTPHNIYHRPANRFVAGFVGSPTMNFRAGRVGDSGGAGLRGARACACRSPAIAGSTDRQPGSEVELGVRPEHIAIGGRDGAPPHEAEVELVEPMGAETLVWCRIAGTAAVGPRRRRQHASRPASVCRSPFRPSGSISSTPQTGLRL